MLILDVAPIGGRVLTVRAANEKGVTGYDMTALLVGSEGTLAVTTRAIAQWPYAGVEIDGHASAALSRTFTVCTGTCAWSRVALLH